MNILDLNKNVITDKKDLLKGFYAGCKPKSKFKIGVEYERLLVNKKTYQTVPYYGDKGIHRFLRQIAFNDEWSYLSDFGNVIGLKKGQNTITLEPGGQFEISLEPKETVNQIEAAIETMDRKLFSIANKLDIKFINCGVSPFSTYKEISLIPKKRYSVMAETLSGALLNTMMRETAGIQVAVDYESESDAMKKLEIALKVSPVMTAIFANSPVYNSKLSAYKSYRALSWLNTDEKRCGLISKKIFDSPNSFSFKDYVDVLLDIPMLFIIRDGKVIELKNEINFESFIKNGFKNFEATLDDFSLHSSLFFPECRLNSYLEIRNHDCQKGILKYSIPAIYKGIFYCSQSMNEVLSIFNNLSYEDFFNARQSVPQNGLETILGDLSIKYYAQQIVQIAKKYLKKEQYSECKYIEPVENLLNEGVSPADLLIQKWEKEFENNIESYINYICE